MSTPTSLLEELEAAGELEARSRFSIDADKAREKLRSYQLADPHRYVLLLVEAAVQCGARELRFEVDSDDVHLRYQGRPFTYEQLNDIYASLFIEVGELDERGREQLRGLQQLAFAVNSAMALNPRWVRVTSVDVDGTGVALELRPDQPDEVRRVEGQPPGTHVHVRDRFRPGLVVEFFRSLGGTTAEAVLLREHCRWSRTPIFLGNASISGDDRDEQRWWWAVDVVDDGQVIGRAGLGALDPETKQPLPPSLRLLSNGVFIETMAMPEAVDGFAALIDSKRLRKDVSQSQLLRDEAYAATLRAVMAAHARLVARLAERRMAGTAPAWADACALQWLLRGRWVHPEHDLHQLLRDHPTFAAVAELRLWPTVGAAAISTRALIESQWPIRFATAPFDFAPVDVPFVVLADEAGILEALEALFASQTSDYTATLQRELERQHHRLAFMARAHLPELPSGYFLIRESIHATQPDGAPIRGELGLRSLGTADSWVRLLAQGCQIEEVHLEDAIPGLCVVVESTLAPGDDYTWTRADDALAHTLFAVLEALERMLAKLAASGVVGVANIELRDLLRDYLRRVCSRDFERDFLVQFGFSNNRVRGHSDARRRFAIRPEWKLDGDEAQMHPLVQVPLFLQAQGSPRTLLDLVRRRRAGERLPWLEPDHGPLPALDRSVLALDRSDRDVLRVLLGDDALESYVDQLAWLRRREAFMARPLAAMQLQRATLIRAPLRGATSNNDATSSADSQPALRGELGLREFTSGAVALPGTTPIQVFHQGRALCEVQLPLPLPGLTAWIDDPHLGVNHSFDGLHEPSRLRAPLLATIPDLLRLQLDRARGGPSHLQACEWWLLALIPNLVFGDGGRGDGQLFLAFRQLRRELGVEPALDHLDRCLALLERFPTRDLERVIGRLRGRAQQPTAEAVEAELRRPSARVDDDERALAELRRASIPALRELLLLPLYRGFILAKGSVEQTRRWSLHDLLNHLDSDQPLAWVPVEFTLSAAPALELAILGLDAVEQRLLQGLAGADALEPIGEWLSGRARFERRRRIDDLQLPAGSAVVTVAIDHDGVRGQLGLAFDPATTRSKIRLYTEGREVTILDLPATPLAILGVLEVADLAMTPAHDDVTGDERKRLRALIEAQEGTLLHMLAERFPQCERTQKPILCQLVRLALLRWPPGTGGYRNRADKKRKRFAALAALPVFPGARKPWSAVELAEAAARGPIMTIDARDPTQPLPDGPVIVLDPPDVELVIQQLFGHTRDLAQEWAQQRRIHARKAQAPALPGKPPGDALARVTIHGQGLEGWLAIVSLSTTVGFGEDGKTVERREISALFPCTGAVWGEGLEISADWSRIIITRPQEQLLERRAAALWEALIDDFQAMCGDAAPTNSAGRRHFAGAREALHALFLRLHEQLGRSYGRRKKRGRKAANHEQAIYARCRDLPVLRLANGRWISAEIAERERPIELAHLELWRGPSAEERAAQEAARRRDAQRAAERERARREREHLQAQEAARKREAARRRDAQRDAQRRAEQEAKARRQAKAAEEAEQARRRAEEEAKARLPSPETLLLEALREELRLVRGKRSGLVGERALESLRLIDLDDARDRDPLFTASSDGPRINPRHRLFVAVLARYLDDPAWLTLLASAAYTFLNIVHVEITDADEAVFLAAHAGYAATTLAGDEPGA